MRKMLAAALPTEPHARLLVSLLAGITALVWLSFFVAFSLHRVYPIDGIKRFVDIGAEANLPTWWNTCLLALVAFQAADRGITSHLRSHVRTRNAWATIAAIAAGLSLDEATALHERLDAVERSLGTGIPTYGWLVAGSVVGLFAAAVLIASGRQLPVQLRRPLAGALFAYGAGAVGFEAIGGWLDTTDLPGGFFTVAIVIEESLEMWACVYAIGVLLSSDDAGQE